MPTDFGTDMDRVLLGRTKDIKELSVSFILSIFAIFQKELDSRSLLYNICDIISMILQKIDLVVHLQ